MKEHGRSRCKVSRIVDVASVNQASGRGSRQEINLPRGLVVIDLHINCFRESLHPHFS
jgi:hypothetical protein